MISFKLYRSSQVGAAVAVIVVVAACGGGGSGDAKTVVGTTSLTSFQRLQTEVFDKSCAFTACHAVGNSSGSGLVLTGSGVHGRLVGTLPTNSVARADGLKLVAAGKPDSSLLWHKLNGWLAGHHQHNYGVNMPQAGLSLSVEQLTFVRQWIEQGALSTGDAISPALLAGTTRPESAPYVSLAPPANGFQLTLSPFTVKSAFERELFVYKSVGNSADVYVNRIETKMRAGSHHFVLYTFGTNTPGALLPAVGDIRDIRNTDGTYNFFAIAPMEYHVFFAGTQAQTSDFTFPDGVAMRVPAGTRIDLNSHYVNSGQQETVGQAEANLYTVPLSSVQYVASALNLNNTDLTLPKGRDTTITKTFTFSRVTRVVGLTSHMHKRGVQFVIRIVGGARNGEIVYTNTSWDHPPFVGFTTPIVLQPGEGLRSEVLYRGDASKVVKFGLTSEDEMDIIFGYWY